MHPAGRQFGLCVRDGRRAGGLPSPVWGQRSSGVSGRDEQTTGEGDAPAASATTWGCRRLRLRIRAQRREQSVYAVRAPGGVAPGGSDRPAHPCDWAWVVRQLVDGDYADKDRIVLVMDNLNTHHAASLYEAFEPAEARRIAERLEIHYTPKHGSWLTMAEIEIGVMARQCLDRRIPDQSVLRREVGAWQQQRNQDAIRVDWRFTTNDARIKLRSLYPSIQH